MQLFTEYERTDDAVRCVETPQPWEGNGCMVRAWAISLAVLVGTTAALGAGVTYVRNSLGEFFISMILGPLLLAALLVGGFASLFLIHVAGDALFGVRKRVLTLDADGFCVRQRKGFRRWKDEIRLPLAKIAGFQVRRNCEEESSPEDHDPWWWYEILVETHDADQPRVWIPLKEDLEYRDDIIALAADLNAVLGKLKNIESPYQPQA